MNDSSKKVIYFFQNGRKDRILNRTIYAKEMFYGYHHFRDKNYLVDIIEFREHKSKLGRLFFITVEKRLRNILKLPLYWSFVTNRENLKKILRTDFIIFANNRMASSVLPLVLYSKVLKSKASNLTFIMGLFSRSPRYKILEIIQQFYIILFLKTLDNFVFLSKGEMNFAISKYKKYKNKFHYLPFAVDLDVWKKESISKEDYILFVGNDGFRDFSLVEKLTKEMPDKKFILISEEIDGKNLSSNSRVIKGSWGSPAVTDLELKEIYQKAKLTILPINDSLQPSGQSVALQSIACGTPVLITETRGFWDHKNFKDDKNIFFAKNNDLSYWVEKIEYILNFDTLTKNKFIDDGIKTVSENYDFKKFSQKVEEILTKT